MNTKKRRYEIFLDDILIGWSFLEKSDSAMGVVFGKIIFNNIESGYALFKDYCLQNNEGIVYDIPEKKLIDTSCLSSLKVFNSSGVEILGLGTNIEAIGSDEFSVVIVGIPYQFFKVEFPQHLQKL